jgi:hypothetical protein
MFSGESRLAYLMSFFHISSNDLAAELNIHYSLVSKWKTRKRPISGKGGYPAQIASFFVKLDAPGQFARLKAILADAFPGVILDAPDTVGEYLEIWLSEQNQTRADISDRGYLGHVLSHAVFDVYKGAEGKADCVSRLLDTALSFSEPQKLFVWDSQRMHAILDGGEFVPNQSRVYGEILKKGGSLTMIHTLNRKSQEILFSVLEMLPLYATGQAHGYLEHNFSEPPVKFAVYLLENIAAVLSVEFFDNKNTTTSYFITDPTTLSNIMQFYKTILRNCEPLFHKIGESQANLFFNYQKDALTQKGVIYCLRTQILPLYSMSDKLFLRLFEENDFPRGEIAAQIESHETLHNIFLRSIDQNDFRILLMLPESPESFLREPHYVKFSNGPLRVSSDIFLEHLREIDRLCKKKPRLKVFSTNNLFLPPWRNTNIIVKENGMILVTSTEQFAGLQIRISDPVIRSAFFAYLSKEWYSIPSIKEYNNLPKIFAPFLERHAEEG